VAQHHVQHEQHAVAEREHEPERLAPEPELRDRGDPGGREQQRERVAPGPDPERGEQHRAEELDCSHGGQRQPVHRQVEQAVHGG
jgi:hypothetical protein